MGAKKRCPMESNEVVEATVGMNTRVTLPKLMNITVGDKLYFKYIGNNQYVMTVGKHDTPAPLSSPGRKQKIFGLVLGKRPQDGKWIGLYLDSNGCRCAIQISSSQHYLEKDLGRVGPKARTKLNDRFNGEWDFPILIKDTSWNNWEDSNLKEAIKQATEDFLDGVFDLQEDA